MGALRKEAFTIEADRNAVGQPIHVANPQPDPIDYSALRKRAMSKFTKARAYLAR